MHPTNIQGEKIRYTYIEHSVRYFYTIPMLCFGKCQISGSIPPPSFIVKASSGHCVPFAKVPDRASEQGRII